MVAVDYPPQALLSTIDKEQLNAKTQRRQVPAKQDCMRVPTNIACWKQNNRTLGVVLGVLASWRLDKKPE
jgi:hypothetical protein